MLLRRNVIVISSNFSCSFTAAPAPAPFPTAPPAPAPFPTTPPSLSSSSCHPLPSSQIVRYVGGQKYDQHYDYFNPQFYQQDASTLRMINNGQRNRLVTVLWYLTTVGVGGGGHTIFPLVNGSKIGPNYNYSGEWNTALCLKLLCRVVFCSITISTSVLSYKLLSELPAISTYQCVPTAALFPVFLTVALLLS